MNNNILGNRLKEMRKSKGITQSQLADDLNVALSVIAGAETKRGISKNLAPKLAEYFNTSVDYWINEDAEKEFIIDSEFLETTKIVAKRFIDENIITLNNIDNISKDEMDLLIKSLKFDLKVYLKKKDL